MYIYTRGAIGQAVSAKIENYKTAVKGGEKSSESFAETLKAQLVNTNRETKVVSATGNNTFAVKEKSDLPKINGSTLLYAIQNSESDTTASAVLSDLGFLETLSGSTTELKAAADSLSKTASNLVKLGKAGSDGSVMTSQFVSDFNKLITLLNSESSSSAYLYKNALNTAVLSSESELATAGISFENGYMRYSGETGLSAIPDALLNNIAISANAVSTYAGTLAGGETDYNGVGDYYNAIIRSYM